MAAAGQRWTGWWRGWGEAARATKAVSEFGHAKCKQVKRMAVLEWKTCHVSHCWMGDVPGAFVGRGGNYAPP